jgi:glycolate oxidase iron-sulfur subunit
MARRLLERKIRHLGATGAEAVVTANPGCILQMAAGLRRRGVSMRVLHIVELLDEAYAAAERAGTG